jgi:beta-lactamase regulating signal transducer with metallopeptidase domain|tara:strand:- start:558 stop:821 length:264 start_codon:yes stop_codon:yes gene_type:complete
LKKELVLKNLDYKMMLSVGKIFWLIIILIAVWYLFKIIEKRKLNIDKNNQKKENDDINKKGIDAFKCDVCGLWSTGKKCNNKECTNS